MVAADQTRPAKERVHRQMRQQDAILVVFSTGYTRSPNGSEVHPASYTMGIGSLPGVKQPGRGVYHPPPFSAEVNERVEL